MAFPVNGSLEITTNTFCTLRCKYCPQEVLKDAYGKEMMLSYGDFKTIVDKLPPKVRIDFSGFSEPFLNEDCVKMIQYADKLGREVCVFTTLVGMTATKFNKIRKIPFSMFCIHLPDIDGCSGHVATADYLKLLDKIYKSGVSNLSFTCMGKASEETEEKIRYSHYDRFLDDRAGHVESLISKKKKYRNGCVACSVSKFNNQWVMLPDGEVVLCCMDWGLQHSLGDLLSESYEEIYNSSVLRHIRSARNDQTVEILCRKCRRGMNV